MKVLSIGTDRKIFEENSAVRERVILYGHIFDELHIVVFSIRGMNYESRPTESFGQARINISENVFAYPTNSRNRLFYIIDAFLIIKKLIKNSRFKIENYVVSTQDPFETGLVGLLLKLRYKLPLQIQLHTDFANRYFITHSSLNFIRFPLGLFVLSFADSVRVVSWRIAKSIHSLTHNISVLPIYTQIERLKDLKIERLEKKEKITFLTVARLEKEKDLETAIKAFALLKIEAEFVIVGGGGERDNLERLSERLLVKEKVKFVGWQNDLTIFYQDADVYISTSLYEGYGISTVEAALHGLPLILSDAGVADDFFIDQKEAMVCKPKDVSGFAGAMKELSSNLELRQNMGERAKISAEENEISLNEYLQKYKSSIQQASIFSEANHGLFKKNILLRYLAAGITAASTNIGLLYIFTDLFKIWYLYSSVLSFVFGISISFILQKFWTFGDRGTSKIHHQAFRYLGVAILGLGFNTVCMFVLVDILHIWYILGQVITGGLIMVFNFLMYKFFIFNNKYE